MSGDAPVTALTLWTHEPAISSSDAVLNFDLVEGFDPAHSVLQITANASTQLVSSTTGSQLPRAVTKKVVVLPSPLSSEVRKRTPNLQISLSIHLSNVFKIKSRSTVSVAVIPKSSCVANYMVLYFRDQYISRADMWRAACALEGQCIYVGKRINSIAGTRAEVRELWRDGKKRSSAYISASTKPVFRSESARYLIFIQMSKEMWEFEEDGELFYNKAIDGFLPELFKRWRDMNAHHLVSIVLFTRVTYRGIVGPFCLAKPRPGESADLREPEDGDFHNDFYKVVVDNVSSHSWETTLTELKRELHGFQRDVMLQKMKGKMNDSEQIISGYITSAMEGNVLEAINLAAHQFNRDHIDRDLLRTGTSMIFVTAGSGLFEVDENLLKLTGENLLGNGIGIDVVCLSKRPLHVTPLFKYARADQKEHHSVRSSIVSLKTEKASDPNGFEYILPYICEISYYGDHHTLDLASTDKKFQARLKMHELQMMGLMENEMSSISIDFINNHVLLREQDMSKYSLKLDQILQLYDDSCFMPQHRTQHLIREFIDGETHTNARDDTEGAELFGTSLPSSDEGEHFAGFYERSRSSTKHHQQLGRHDDRIDSLDSSMEVSPQWSFDSRKASPVRERLIRPKHFDNLSVSPKRTVVKRAPSTRVFSNPLANLMALKAPPTNSPLTGAETISSALNASQPRITKGFDLPVKTEPLAAAIPIRLKEQNMATPRKHLTPADIGEAKVQTVSQSLRSNVREQRLSISSNVQTKASLAKMRTELQIEEALPTPWHVLDNPSFPAKNRTRWNTRSWRWADISNRARRTGSMNWESMCAPAALPLSSIASIDVDQLKSSLYSENSYSICINPDAQDLTQKDLLREMIGQRLGQGYQLVKAKSQSTLHRQGRRNSSKAGLSHGPLGELEDTIYLSYAEMEVHCLTCDPSGYMVEVIRYVRKRELPKPVGYNSLIWQLARHDGYETSVVLFRPTNQSHNWNYVDQIMSGTENRLTEAVKFWRARFLFIPGEIAKDKRPANMGEQFTDEEVRVAGINKICDMIQKAIYITPADRKARKDTKPLEAIKANVTFTTLDAPSFVQHEIQHFSSEADMPRGLGEPTTTISTKDISLYDVSNEMQSDKGVHIKDRLWHWRWYESSWVGSEFVTWLIERTDLNTREEATKFAQDLMDRDLFEHVQKKHSFLDGFYLYRLKPEYSSKTAKTWFGTRRVTPTVPTRTRAHSNVSSSSANSPVIRPQSGSRRQFQLTKCMRIDVDPHKRSYRPEFVLLHQDIIHNPEHCFHIRLEWIAATAKLVEETVQQYSRIAEKYGLTLVEAPVDEAVAVTASNPFRAPLEIKLALLEFHTEDWCEKVLQHWNFKVDQSAARKFPSTVDVLYSWGRPDYKFTQWVHRSGMALCQVHPAGYFMWLTNRLYVSRPRTEQSGKGHVASIAPIDPDSLRTAFVEWCGDVDALHRFSQSG